MKVYWVIGILMVSGLRAQTQNCTVDVYVLAGVPMPSGMLLGARSTATRMFREIGVNVRMRNGIPAHGASDACGAPILIRIENAGETSGGSFALANALPYKNSGTCIHVFLDRVRERLNHQAIFGNALLAHVMVHEITHVLERIDRHSAEGVMKAQWSAEDYQQMKLHPLPFAPADVNLIHDGIVGRITPHD